jgi:hypothetical protein
MHYAAVELLKCSLTTYLMQNMKTASLKRGEKLKRLKDVKECNSSRKRNRKAVNKQMILQQKMKLVLEVLKKAKRWWQSHQRNYSDHTRG